MTGKILNLNVCLKLSAVYGCGVEGHLGSAGLRLSDRSLNRIFLAENYTRVGR